MVAPEPFLLVLRRQRIALFIVAALVDLGGIACAVSGALLQDDTTLALISLGFVLLALGGYCVWSGWRRLHHPALRLFERPEEVVWVWPTKHLINNVHANTSYAFCTADGKKPKLVALARDEAAADALVRQHFPQALFGFKPQWEAAFRANPRAFRANAQSGPAAPLAEDQALTEVLRIIRRYLRIEAIALVLAAWTFGSCVIALGLTALGIDQTAVIVVLAACAVVSFFGLGSLFFRDPKKHWVARALLEAPTTITGIELSYVRLGSGHKVWAKVHTAKKTFPLALRAGSEEPIVAALRARVARARAGASA